MKILVKIQARHLLNHKDVTWRWLHKGISSSLFFAFIFGCSSSVVEPESNSRPDKSITELTGTISHMVYDNFENGTSYETVSLHTKDGKEIPLWMNENSAALKSGMNLSITGAFDSEGKEFRVFSHSNISMNSIHGLTTEEASALGEQRILILLAKFENENPSLPVSVNTLMGQMDTFYRENSFNQISLSWEVHGWYQVAAPPIENNKCDMSITHKEALEAAFDDGVDISSFGHVVVIAPFNCPDWNGGLASIGETEVTTDDGTYDISIASIHSTDGMNKYVLSHEFGHQLGNTHAAFYVCNDPNESIRLAGCTSWEYKDWYSTMGTGLSTYNFRHFNAREKDKTGWLAEGQRKRTVDSIGTQTFTIFPISSPDSDMKVLKIPRGSGLYMYVEYRQPIGFDSWLNSLPQLGAPPVSTDVFEGPLIHFDQIIASGSGQRTELVDATVSSSNPAHFSSTALLPGVTIVDPMTGNSVRGIQKIGSGFQVQVTVVATDYADPTVQITSPTTGTSVDGTFTINAQVQSVLPGSIVHFSIGNELIGSDDSPPYSAQFNPSGLSNGPLVLQAQVLDRGNKIGYAQNVTVFYDSGGGDDGSSKPLCRYSAAAKNRPCYLVRTAD